MVNVAALPVARRAVFVIKRRDWEPATEAWAARVPNPFPHGFIANCLLRKQCDLVPMDSHGVCVEAKGDELLVSVRHRPYAEVVLVVVG